MHHFISTLCFLLFYNAILKANINDTIFLKGITADVDLTSANVKGAEIVFKINIKDSKREGTKIPPKWSFKLQVFKDNNIPAETVQTSLASNNNGIILLDNCKSVLPKNIVNECFFFLPYYALKLEEGGHKLKIKLAVFIWDTVTCKYVPSNSVISGSNEKHIVINKPATKNLQLFCSGVRIREIKAASWDVGLIGYPDLVYKVSLVNRFVPDYILCSTEMQNAVSAAWIDYSQQITISEGDKITFGII